MSSWSSSIGNAVVSFPRRFMPRSSTRFYTVSRAFVRDPRLPTAYRLRPPGKGASRNRCNSSPSRTTSRSVSLYIYNASHFSPFLAVRFTHRHFSRVYAPRDLQFAGCKKTEILVETKTTEEVAVNQARLAEPMKYRHSRDRRRVVAVDDLRPTTSWHASRRGCRPIRDSSRRG